MGLGNLQYVGFVLCWSDVMDPSFSHAYLFPRFLRLFLPKVHGAILNPVKSISVL